MKNFTYGAAMLMVGLTIGMWTGSLDKMPIPKFQTSGDERLAWFGDKPALLLERTPSQSINGVDGWQWSYFCIVDGEPRDLPERDLKPGNTDELRRVFRELNGESFDTTWVSSSPDVHIDRAIDVHVGTAGTWSFPIKDGQVTIPVVPAHEDCPNPATARGRHNMGGKHGIP